ncbi:MAG: flagellin FliC, partial [Gemmobacter sp.]
MTGIAINTNVGALSAKAAVGSVNTAMETAMERLSSGKRINAAKDDAAGTSIATRLSAEIASTNQAIRNALDAQALIDSAEGAHGELTGIIIRMRELAVQSVNDTNNIQDRQNLQLEVTALKEEIDRIAAVTTWAGKRLMYGSQDDGGATPKTFTFQVGASQNPQDVISVDIKAMTSTRLGLVDTNAFATIDNLSQTGAVPKAEVSAL